MQENVGGRPNFGIESDSNRFSGVYRVESKLFLPNGNALAVGPSVESCFTSISFVMQLKPENLNSMSLVTFPKTLEAGDRVIHIPQVCLPVMNNPCLC